jgi:hypothetical protein
MPLPVPRRPDYITTTHFDVDATLHRQAIRRELRLAAALRRDCRSLTAALRHRHFRHDARYRCGYLVDRAAVATIFTSLH